VLVQVRRTAPFTATEHARAAALAGLVDDVLTRQHATSPVPTPSGSEPELVADGERVDAVVDGARVGGAVIRPALDEPDVWVLTLTVDPAWRRRGVGSRLLAEMVRLAAARGAGELALTTRADNQAVLPMVLAAGLRGRIKMSGDRLTVRIPLAALHR
jgi:ribosomal protein S18 acetylase RimI-like enzyme